MIHIINQILIIWLIKYKIKIKIKMKIIFKNKNNFKNFLSNQIRACFKKLKIYKNKWKILIISKIGKIKFLMKIKNWINKIMKICIILNKFKRNKNKI